MSFLLERSFNKDRGLAMFKYKLGNKIAAITLCSTLVSAPLVLNAAEQGGFSGADVMMEKHAHKMGKHKFKKMAKHLNLTQEQKEQMKSIRETSREVSLPLREKTKEFFDYAKQLKAQESFDEQGFNAMYSQYQEAFAALALQRAKTKHAMYQVLTEEQKAKMDEYKEKRGKKRKGKNRS